jgi:hypothetical protein
MVTGCRRSPPYHGQKTADSDRHGTSKSAPKSEGSSGNGKAQVKALRPGFARVCWLATAMNSEPDNTQENDKNVN